MQSEEKSAYYKGHLLWKRDGIGIALRYVQGLLMQYRKSSIIWSLYALLQHESGSIKSAIGGYKKVLEIDDSDEKCWFNLGMALLDDGQLQDAKEALLESIHRGSNNEDTFIVLASVYRNLGELREALFILRKAQECNAQEAQIYLLMGHIYLEKELDL